MEATDSSRSRTKRNSEGSTDVRDVDDEGGRNSDSDDRRRHRSSQPRRHGSGDGAEEHDSGRSDGRKRPRSGSRDEEEYNVRRESSLKSARRSSDDRGDRRSSERHRDREAEGSCRSRDEDCERSSSMKGSVRSSGREGSQSRTRNRAGSPRQDSSYAERRDSSREKSHGKREQETYSQHSSRDDKGTGRRHQETGRSDNDSRSIKASDYDKHELSKDRTVESHYESREAKGQSVGSGREKDVKYTGERRVDGERGNSRNRSETQDDNTGPVSAPSAARSDIDRDEKLQKPREKKLEPDGRTYNSKSRGEKHKQQADSTNGGHEESTYREMSVDMDYDRHARTRDRSDRNDGDGKRSRSPERAGKHHRDSDDYTRGFAGSDSERSSGFKSTEREGEYRDGRPPNRRDTSWIDKSKEGESSKDNRNRSQTRQGSRDRGTGFDHSRDWEVRREKVRADSENFRSRPGYRKDTRTRPEGGNSSSSFLNQNENYEMMEPANNHGFGRQESPSMFSGRRTEMGSQLEFASSMNEERGRPPEEKGRLAYGYEDDLQGGQKAATDSDNLGVEQSSGSGAQTPRGGSFGRTVQQGQRGARAGRGGRLTGRENQRVGVPMPMMGSPFGQHGVPPPQMLPITPNMPHPVPHMGQGVVIPPFASPLVWPGARGIDMNMLAMPPNLPPIPPGLAGARYPPNMGIGTNHDMYYNQPCPGRAALPNMSNPGLNATGTNGRGAPHDKGPAGWGSKKNNGPFGKAPSRGEQNDYSQNFVDTGVRPQNFIRELELTNVVEDYPKLRELIQKKDEIVANSASAPMYYKCDLRERVLSPELFGTKFDVILVDPPWEEYVHRAPGVTDQMEYWTFEEIQNLKIEAIADTPSFIFLWVGDGVGLEQGRQCLKKWGFRRCEDICWVKTNKVTATPGLRHDSHTLFQHTKEHCLMGIKGTVRRSIDGHIIHANIDTDVIIGEEPPYGSTVKPDEMYRIIEHFALGKRRLELFGEDHNIRAGWLTIGKGLSSSNFNAEAYIRNFADEDGKVWQGVAGRNPPPAAPHLVVTTPDIESLRPKSPPPKNQQQPIPVMSGGSNNRRSMGNSVQIPLGPPPNSGPNLDNSCSEPATPVPWGASPMRGVIGPDGGHGCADDKIYQGFGFNPTQACGDWAPNML